MSFARLVLWLSVPAYGLVGLGFLLAPATLAGCVELDVAGPSADNDVRAVWGGGQLGLAVFLALAAGRPAWHLPGLWVLVLTMGGLFGARLLSELAIGAPAPQVLALQAAEGVGLVAGGIALWRLRTPERRPSAPSGRVIAPDLWLRPFTLADHGAAHALWQRSDGVSVGLSDTREAIARFLERNPGIGAVAVDERGALVGAVLAGHDGRRGTLHHLAVEPAWRRRGVGRALVSHCLEQLAALGIPKVNVFLFTDNEEGAAFWAREGWREVDWTARQRVLQPDPEDAC